MGKGKRTRASKGKQRRQGEREMAPAFPVPDPFFRPDPVGTVLSPYTRRELSKSVNAWQFLLNYLSYVQDGGLEVPAEQFEPRRPEETAEQAELRIKLAQTMREVQALAGNWRDLCAEVLTWIPRNDAAEVAENIIKVGVGWLHESGYTPEREAWVAGARRLVGALCPPRRWMAALDLLDMQAAWGMRPATDSPELALAVHDEPVAAIHVAAASVAWLFGTPGAVTDPQAAHRKLAEDANNFAAMV